MITFSPSILSADFVNLERDIHAIEKAGGDWLHVDVMDGNFVPNITIGIPVVKAIRRVTNLPLDVHLMIDKPIRYVEQFVKAGADYLTIHVEADTEENNLAALSKIRALGAKAGISLKPGTPAEAALPYLPLCDLILVMTVEPGFGGQKFKEEMLPKMAALRAAAPSAHISVDGGIDPVTAPRCVASGVDVLVAGSAFFRAEDRGEFVQSLKNL